MSALATGSDGRGLCFTACEKKLNWSMVGAMLLIPDGADGILIGLVKDFRYAFGVVLCLLLFFPAFCTLYSSRANSLGFVSREASLGFLGSNSDRG